MKIVITIISLLAIVASLGCSEMVDDPVGPTIEYGDTTIVVPPQPEPDTLLARATADPRIGQVPFETRLTGIPIGADSLISETWSVNGQVIAYSGTVLYEVLKAGNYLCIYEWTGSNGTASDTILVMGTEEPVAQDTLSTSGFVTPTEAEAPRTIDLYGTFHGGTPPHVEEWRLDGRVVANKGVASVHIEEAGIYDLTYRVTDGKGDREEKYFLVRLDEPEGPEPGSCDSIRIEREVDLAVSPNANNDYVVIYTGLRTKIVCDILVYVKWNSPAESDMTLRVNNQPYALPDPMVRPRYEWIRITGVRIGNEVALELVMNKGSSKKDDDGSSQRKANEVTKIVIEACVPRN